MKQNIKSKISRPAIRQLADEDRKVAPLDNGTLLSNDLSSSEVIARKSTEGRLP